MAEEISQQNSSDKDLLDTISDYLEQKKEKTPEPEIIENKAVQEPNVEVLKEINEHLNDLQAMPRKVHEEVLKTPPPSPADVVDANSTEVEEHFEKCDVSKGKIGQFF